MADTSALKNLAVSETGFVFDPRTGATFTLNATGLAVLTALRDYGSIEAAVERLKERFDGVPASAHDEITEFVQSLRTHGLVA